MSKRTKKTYNHYENTLIQMYWKFDNQKKKKKIR